LSNALAGHLDAKLFTTNQLATLHKSTKKRFDAFVTKVEDLFNTEVWGTPFVPTHWNLPVDDREKRYSPCVLTMRGARLPLIPLTGSLTFYWYPTTSLQCTSSVCTHFGC
jgi:hypothetical protein